MKIMRMVDFKFKEILAPKSMQALNKYPKPDKAHVMSLKRVGTMLGVPKQFN